MSADPRHVRPIGSHDDPAVRSEAGRVEGYLRACGAALAPMSDLSFFSFLAAGETLGRDAPGEIEIAVLDASFRRGGEIRIWNAEIRAGADLAGPLYWRPVAPSSAARTEGLALRANVLMTAMALGSLIALSLLGNAAGLDAESRTLLRIVVFSLALVAAAHLFVVSRIFGEGHRQIRRRLAGAPPETLSVATPDRG